MAKLLIRLRKVGVTRPARERKVRGETAGGDYNSAAKFCFSFAAAPDHVKFSA